MSFSPERVRVRGRSPAFNALAATFENSRNLSTPPPVVRKPFPKSSTPTTATDNNGDDSSKPASRPKSTVIASLTTTFQKPAQDNVPRALKGKE